MPTKPKQRIISAEEKRDETEFSRRRSDPHVDVRHVGGGPRSHTVALHHHQLGDIGSRTEITKHGKVVSVLFVLPPMPKYVWHFTTKDGASVDVQALSEAEAGELARETSRRSGIELMNTRPRRGAAL